MEQLRLSLLYLGLQVSSSAITREFPSTVSTAVIVYLIIANTTLNRLYNNNKIVYSNYYFIKKDIMMSSLSYYSS